MNKSKVKRILKRIDDYQMKIHDLYYQLKDAEQTQICNQLDDNGIGRILVDVSSMIDAYKKPI